MPITLYGPQQTRAMRATWMLRELGLDFEHVTDGSPVQVQSTGGDFLIHDRTRYPALVDGSTILYESFAITQYLASKYGADTELAPKTVVILCCLSVCI